MYGTAIVTLPDWDSPYPDAVTVQSLDVPWLSDAATLIRDYFPAMPSYDGEGRFYDYADNTCVEVRDYLAAELRELVAELEERYAASAPDVEGI